MACSKKNYLERNDKDKALAEAVKKLNKNSNDEKALEAVPVLYDDIQKNHLARIRSLSASNDPARWDKIISEYKDLQEAYEYIINSSAAFKLVSPQSYSDLIFETTQAAAEDNYSRGAAFMLKSGRDNARKAFLAFRKSEKYVPGFKDAREKMNLAYESAVLHVVINPVQDNSFFYNSGWGNSGYNYSNEYFQQTLVRDLGNNGDRNPARFYTDWQAGSSGIQPDWVVDLTLRNMDIPQPLRNTYRRNVSQQIESGRDTSGRPQFRTVYATMNITKMYFSARAELAVNIREKSNGKNISYNSFRDEYRWEQESASYSGDSRALSSYDWNMVNNQSYYNVPTRDDILNEMYRKIYPQVRNHISNSVNW